MLLIRLDLFHKLGNSLSVDQDIFLDDNLEDDRTLTSYNSETQDINRFPYKMSFTAAVVSVRGRFNSVINGRQYYIPTGDALIVQSGSIVESLSCSSDLKVIAMAFTDRSDTEYNQRSTSEVSSIIRHRAFPVTMHFDEDRLRTYVTLYKCVKDIYRTTDRRLKGDVVRGFLQISTASFAGCIKEKEDSTGNLQSRANELYLGFLDDLQKYCTLERSVEFYAGRRCVSTKYFTRQIKAASGKSPGRIIRERILIEAKALLNSTDLTVSQISEAMHFPNMSFFCRWFKMFSGLTPTGFRKKGYVETEVPM